MSFTVIEIVFSSKFQKVQKFFVILESEKYIKFTMLGVPLDQAFEFWIS